MSNYLIKRYPNNDAVNEETAKIIEDKIELYNNIENYKKMLSFIDYTDLHAGDKEEKIKAILEYVNTLSEKYLEAPQIAALCIFPRFAKLAKDKLINKNISVSCAFDEQQMSNGYLEIIKKALDDGVDEIEVPFPLKYFAEGMYREALIELLKIKKLCGTRYMKVLLEIDTLKDYNEIYNAAYLAMDGNADFISVSSRIAVVNQAAFEGGIKTVCEAITEFNARRNAKISIKVSQEFATSEHALRIYTLISEILGTDYQEKILLRFEGKELVESLLQKIYEEH